MHGTAFQRDYQHQDWGIQMKYVEQEFARGPQGNAFVRSVQDFIQIQMLNKAGQPEGRVYQFSKNDMETKTFPDGNYSVSISSQGDRLYGIRPLNGSYAARFKRFTGKEGQLPTPKHVTGTRHDPKKNVDYPVDELTFSAIAVIENGPYKGMELLLPFLYARKGSGFVDDGQGGLNYKGGGDKGKLLVTFLEAAGVWSKPLPFSDNVLPMLEAELQRVNKTFMVVIQNGWPVAFSEMPDFSQFMSQPQPPTPKQEDLNWDADKREELTNSLFQEPLPGDELEGAVKTEAGWASRAKAPPARPTSKKAISKAAKKVSVKGR